MDDRRKKLILFGGALVVLVIVLLIVLRSGGGGEIIDDEKGGSPSEMGHFNTANRNIEAQWRMFSRRFLKGGDDFVPFVPVKFIISGPDEGEFEVSEVDEAFWKNLKAVLETREEEFKEIEGCVYVRRQLFKDRRRMELYTHKALLNLREPFLLSTEF